jgi:hypothetical protein
MSTQPIPASETTSVPAPAPVLIPVPTSVPVSVNSRLPGFWYDNPEVLIDDPLRVFPNEKDSLVQKLNAISRLGVYTSVVLVMYHKDIKWIFVGISVLIVTWYLWSKATKESFTSDSECVAPTSQNPFMNPVIGDGIGKPACNVLSASVKAQTRKAFETGLYRDFDDVFNRKNSQRQFYTVPHNDQTKLAKWLYSTPKTCKEDPSACVVYEDLRAKRPEFVNPNINPLKSI